MPEMLARRATPPINWKGVPLKYHNRVSAVCRSLTECEDLVRWFGDPKFCPLASILLLIPEHPTLLVGAGYATAAELRDDAVNLWGKYTERLAKTGSLMDFDSLRERHGLMRREELKDATASAFWERIRAHRANPITDPFRQPNYPRVNGKTVFPSDGFNGVREAKGSGLETATSPVQPAGAVND